MKRKLKKDLGPDVGAVALHPVEVAPAVGRAVAEPRDLTDEIGAPDPD